MHIIRRWCHDLQGRDDGHDEADDDDAANDDEEDDSGADENRNNQQELLRGAQPRGMPSGRHYCRFGRGNRNRLTAMGEQSPDKEGG